MAVSVLKLRWASSSRLTRKLSVPKRATDDAFESRNVAPLGIRWNALLYSMCWFRQR